MAYYPYGGKLCLVHSSVVYGPSRKKRRLDENMMLTLQPPGPPYGPPPSFGSFPGSTGAPGMAPPPGLGIQQRLPDRHYYSYPDERRARSNHSPGPPPGMSSAPGMAPPPVSSSPVWRRKLIGHADWPH